MKQLKRSNVVMCVVMLLLCTALCLLPERYENASTHIPRERVRIEEVDNSGLYPIGIVYSGVQNCRVTVLSGEHAGESAMASNYLNSALDKDKLYVPGDVAHAMVQMGEHLTVTLIDHARTGAEALIVLALAGVSPIAAAFVTVTALTVMIDLLVGGLTRKTLIASALCVPKGGRARA